MIKFVVNGVDKTLSADPRTPLLEVLREDLGLTGTKYGCGEGECGACTVIVNGKTICSCLALAGAVEGNEITTIEGIGNDPVGVSLAINLANEGGVQCGFCTPGFVMQGWSAVTSGEVRSEEDLRDALGGNLCRCTGYSKILTAMQKSVNDSPGSPLSARLGSGTATSLQMDGYWRPASLAELRSGLAAQVAPYRFAAGYTDLMVQEQHHLKDLTLIDLAAVSELRGIREDETYISIGAMTCWTDIIHSPEIAAHSPVLAMAAREIGAMQIQNRATIGGNISNASPAADGLPPLYAYDAEILCMGPQGERAVPIADFVQGPRRVALEPGEFIAEIRIPKAGDRRAEQFFFEKRGPRKAQTISKASVAYHAWTGADGARQVRIAIGAVAPTVLRVPEAERLLAAGGDREEAAAALMAAARPITDIRSTAEYRRDLVGGLLLHGLARATAN
ncbi:MULTISPECIES: FAD binding domain-containing protein [Rhizobium/Agrobacterium group]|uniref:FAD binding domain-containing protein n=1 Tax=Agrobacterium cucumeris TaxID=2862866 RepID=A0ABY8RVQ8_9HYPH|nr:MULTISPECIES: FAD binding domain-containing protein [Rhizobium/Agrobacterium group]MCZ7472714.1 FAD binding domain-containing protein [Rhizobium rhizogenes]MCZ7484040.1 FAD binding domain-containing protein [Rhizobium rhizogenes]WHO11631.1 FAD binding domain-containing protein [Agrobacterium cucumeris]